MCKIINYLFDTLALLIRQNNSKISYQLSVDLSPDGQIEDTWTVYDTKTHEVIIIFFNLLKGTADGISSNFKFNYVAHHNFNKYIFKEKIWIFDHTKLLRPGTVATLLELDQSLEHYVYNTFEF